jgi:hypothetical protein
MMPSNYGNTSHSLYSTFSSHLGFRPPGLRPSELTLTPPRPLPLVHRPPAIGASSPRKSSAPSLLTIADDDLAGPAAAEPTTTPLWQLHISASVSTPPPTLLYLPTTVSLLALSCYSLLAHASVTCVILTTFAAATRIRQLDLVRPSHPPCLSWLTHLHSSTWGPESDSHLLWWAPDNQPS